MFALVSSISFRSDLREQEAWITPEAPYNRVLHGWGAPVLLTCHHFHASSGTHCVTNFTYLIHSIVNFKTGPVSSAKLPIAGKSPQWHMLRKKGIITKTTFQICFLDFTLLFTPVDRQSSLHYPFLFSSITSHPFFSSCSFCFRSKCVDITPGNRYTPLIVHYPASNVSCKNSVQAMPRLKLSATLTINHATIMQRQVPNFCKQAITEAYTPAGDG